MPSDLIILQTTESATVVPHPVERLLRNPRLTAEMLRAIRRDLGLDRPKEQEIAP